MSRIFLEHLFNQVLGRVRDRSPVCRVESQRLLKHVAEDFLVVVSLEGWVAAEENEEHDSKGPDIAGFVVVALEYFWSDIVWRADNGVHALYFLLL